MSSKLRTTEPSAPQSGNAELGDLSFDDWYETPVFEAEPDERLEQLATSRRAPLRLFAGALLRVTPSRPRKKRGEGAEDHLSMEAADNAPAPAPAGVEPWAPVETAVVEPAPVETAVVEPAVVEPAPVEPAVVEPAPVETAVVEPAPVETAVVEPAPVEPLEAPSRSTGSWRDRTGRFLDRWAALETASQDRIEALVLPKRWRG